MNCLCWLVGRSTSWVGKSDSASSIFSADCCCKFDNMSDNFGFISIEWKAIELHWALAFLFLPIFFCFCAGDLHLPARYCPRVATHVTSDSTLLNADIVYLTEPVLLTLDKSWPDYLTLCCTLERVFALGVSVYCLLYWCGRGLELS